MPDPQSEHAYLKKQLRTSRERFEHGARSFPGLRCVLVEIGPEAAKAGRMDEFWKIKSRSQLIDGSATLFERPDQERITVRTVFYAGPKEAVTLFQRQSDVAGRILRKAGKPFPEPRDLRIRDVSENRSYWVYRLFDLAWHGDCHSLKADRKTWDYASLGRTVMPYARRQIDVFLRVGTWQPKPPQVLIDWARELPDHFFSELPDVFPASADLIDYLLASVARRKKPPGDTGDWNALTDRQRNCMRALLELRAIDADSRTDAKKIAAKAEGRGANVDGFKVPLANLVSRGLLESKTGSRGGYWLSQYGHRLLIASDNSSP